MGDFVSCICNIIGIGIQERQQVFFKKNQKLYKITCPNLYVVTDRFL